MRKMLILLAVVPLATTGGCVAKTAWNVATLPVRATGKAVDLMTTSPSERDQKWVREQRKRDERLEKDRREHDKQCRKHPDDCTPFQGE